MRIAFIVSVFPQLSESFVVSQITGLLEDGHDVSIFAARRPEQPCVSEEVQKYALLQRVTYPAMTPRSRLLRLAVFIRVALRCLGRHPLLFGKAVRLLLRERLFSIRWLLWITGFFDERFDIIHAHFGPNGLRALRLKQAGIPGKYLTTFHGYDVTQYIKARGSDVYRQLLRQGDLFTYNSEATKAKLLRLGCPAEKLVKLPMGVDLSGIQFRERTMEPGQKVNLLSVGRLVEMKGREYAIRAVARTARKFADLQYNIAGDGPLRESLHKLIDDLHVADKIRLLGWVSSEKLESLYRDSHILLHPSVTASDGNMEGQGVVLLEAQAHGLPVLATEHSAFPETIVPGKSGFLVPERDAAALADKLEYLLEHPEIWPKMGKQGRLHVEQQFDLSRMNRRLLDIYGRLLSVESHNRSQ